VDRPASLLSAPAAPSPAQDALRTARLLLDDALASGQLDPETVARNPVDRSLVRRVPTLATRLVQAATRDRAGAIGVQQDIDTMVALRRQFLGPGASAPPRFLVRVDEFPHYLASDKPQRYGTDGFKRFHEIMHGAGVPYLLATLPRVSRHPLDPSQSHSRLLHDDECALLARARSQGATIALHGRDHRSRHRSPRRRSELTGLTRRATSELLDTALHELVDQTGDRPRVFVAPYNRFSARQWPVLAERFDVVGGGPETVRLLGRQSTPQWRGDAVYLPAYKPLHSQAGDVLPVAQRIVDQALGLWTPIVLHWGWEADRGWADLERLAAVLSGHAADWTEFLDAVDRSQ
jgi:hypothetical protein